jgi:Tfp pilus assembly protein PilF
MKKLVLVLLYLFMSCILYAQAADEAESLVKDGVVLEDDGKSDSAIAFYQQALVLDKNNLMALTEMSYSLLSLGRYDDAIKFCRRAIKTHPGDDGLKIVYVSYGNAYDMLKKTARSIEIYDEGLRMFPEYFQLYYNKGITLLGENKSEAAMACFQRSVTLNPDHASSHNALARLLLSDKKKIPALLAFCRFLVLEPESKRSKPALAYLQKIMKGNVVVTGKNSVTIEISPDNLIKNGKQKANDFSSTELLLGMSSALAFDSINRDKSEVEQFISEFGTVCNSLKETEKDNYGFYWDYYVPYFTDMNDKGLIKTFTYIIFSSSENSDITDWIKSHSKEIDDFNKWSDGFSWRIN